MGKIIKILVGIFVVLVITVIVLISMIDVNQYKEDVIAIVEENTGRDFNIEGDFEFALSLIPTVVVEGISLGNADWGTDEVGFKISGNPSGDKRTG